MMPLLSIYSPQVLSVLSDPNWGEHFLKLVLNSIETIFKMLKDGPVLSTPVL